MELKVGITENRSSVIVVTNADQFIDPRSSALEKRVEKIERVERLILNTCSGLRSVVGAVDSGCGATS